MVQQYNRNQSFVQIERVFTCPLPSVHISLAPASWFVVVVMMVSTPARVTRLHAVSLFARVLCVLYSLMQYKKFVLLIDDATLQRLSGEVSNALSAVNFGDSAALHMPWKASTAH
jgi:hypothetical protein